MPPSRSHAVLPRQTIVALEQERLSRRPIQAWLAAADGNLGDAELCRLCRWHAVAGNRTTHAACICVHPRAGMHAFVIQALYGEVVC